MYKIITHNIIPIKIEQRSKPILSYRYSANKHLSNPLPELKAQQTFALPSVSSEQSFKST